MLRYCEVTSTMALLAVFFLYIYVFEKRSKTTNNKYQKEIAEYFEVMRWYGFKDNEIADMVHKIKDHSTLKLVTKKAKAGIKNKS